MSVKKNLDFIKSEFGSDEKIIESAFKLEVLYKRYKHIIWAVAVCAVVVGAIWFIKSHIAESNAQKSSEILRELSQNPRDEKLMADLEKNNVDLYQLFLLKEALENGNTADLQRLGEAQNEFVQYVANYHLGSFERDSALLEKSENYALGDLARIESAYILLKDGKAKEANEILQGISSDSALNEIAKIVAHSTIHAKSTAKSTAQSTKGNSK